jgi:hypothetical protein
VDDDWDYACHNCGDPIPAEEQHDTHVGRCCDCEDLACGMPLASINRERAEKGKKPITRPWPGKDEHGEWTRDGRIAMWRSAIAQGSATEEHLFAEFPELREDENNPGT